LKYCYNVTFSAGTDENSQEEFILPVNRGLIFGGEIRFPPGSAGLLRFSILYAGYKLYPRNRRGYFSGNDEVIPLEDTQLINEPPYELVACGYNLDTTWEHEVIIRIGIISEEIYVQRYLPDVAARRIKAENERLKDEIEIEKPPAFNLILPFRRA